MILLSLLMAAGLEGAAVIATDAVISVVTSLIKISVFGLAGVVTAQVLAFALLIGAIALPGAFLARAFVERMPVHIHTAILDVAVIAGGVVMISSAVRTLSSDESRRTLRRPCLARDRLPRRPLVFVVLFVRSVDFRTFEHGIGSVSRNRSPCRPSTGIRRYLR